MLLLKGATPQARTKRPVSKCHAANGFDLVIEYEFKEENPLAKREAHLIALLLTIALFIFILGCHSASVMKAPSTTSSNRSTNASQGNSRAGYASSLLSPISGIVFSKPAIWGSSANNIGAFGPASSRTLSSSIFSSSQIPSSVPSNIIFNVSLPNPKENNTNLSSATGISSNSAVDGDLTVDELKLLHPKYIRYYFGSTAVFDAEDPTKGVVSVHNPNDSEAKYYNWDLTNWTYTPSLTFDNFISLCKDVGAEPVILLPVYSAYYKGSLEHMTKQELYAAQMAFVRYANITKKYGVKYWEIGNEDDLAGCSAQEYDAIFNELVPELKSVDPTIQCGANNMSGESRWETMLPQIEKNMGFVITHQYTGLRTYEEYLSNKTAQVGTVNDFDTAAEKVNLPADKRKLILTEMSSYSPGEESVSTPADKNCTWKGLLNIDQQLSIASKRYTYGFMNWVTYYSGGLTEPFNCYTEDKKSLTPVGLSCKVVSDNLYNNLGTRYNALGSALYVWISHNDEKSKMSIFILNKTKSSECANINISGFTGIYQCDEWVYSGADEWSTTPTYKQVASSVCCNKFISLNVLPLSVTVLNFNK